MENNSEILGTQPSADTTITATAPSVGEQKQGWLEKLAGLFKKKDKANVTALPTDSPALSNMSPSVDSGTPLGEVASPVNITSEVNSAIAQPDANAALKDLNAQMGAQVGNPFPGAIPPVPSVGEVPTNPPSTTGPEKAA